jgi:hypothetical protein
MADITELAKLLCGGAGIDDADPNCEISQILGYLRNVLISTLRELEWLGTQPDARISIYGPFLVRSLLEVGVTALIGRVDPTRLLVVKRTQQCSNYDTKQPWNSAVRWQGDVVDEKVQQLWEPKKQYKDMTKALLGDYYVALYWKSALQRVADLDITGGTWWAGIKAVTIEEFSDSRRSSIRNLYSQSSKGVHSEFVVPPGSLYDRLTIINLTSQIIQILSELGLLVNFLPHVAYKLGPLEAVTFLNGIENTEVIM